MRGNLYASSFWLACMAIIGTRRWDALEAWSPSLFLVGFAFELVFAVNHGIAYLVDGFAFIEWLYPTVLIGRLAVLLGLAGLSAQIANRNSRFGVAGRVVVSAAVVFTIGLLSLSILEIAGITTPIIAVFGLGTVVLTILTFFLFGIAILYTGAYPTRIGGLMLIATLAVLSVLIGLRFLPTNLIGAVGEGANAIVFLAMWGYLRTEITAIRSAGPAPETIVK